MGAILNGIALHGGTRPYGGTFLVFSDYMRPAVRLAALMKLPVIYVWTHDSIGLGEDGPTHQPVEHLSALRAIPGLDVVRPADANETAWAWRQALEHTDRPTALCADPAERCRPSTGDARRGAEGVGPGRLRAGRGVQRQAAGDPHRHRLRGAALPDRAGAPGGRGHPDPGRLDALPGVVPRAGRGLPGAGAAARGEGAGQRRGGHRDVLAAISSATPASASASSTTARARRTRCCSSSSGSPPTGSWRPRTRRWPGSATSPVPRPATEEER